MLTDNRGAPQGNQNDIESTVWAAFEKQVLPFLKVAQEPGDRRYK